MGQKFEITPWLEAAVYFTRKDTEIVKVAQNTAFERKLVISGSFLSKSSEIIPKIRN